MECGDCGKETALICSSCGQSMCEEHTCVIEVDGDCVRMAVCVSCYENAKQSAESEDMP